MSGDNTLVFSETSVRINTVVFQAAGSASSFAIVVESSLSRAVIPSVPDEQLVGFLLLKRFGMMG